MSRELVSRRLRDADLSADSAKSESAPITSLRLHLICVTQALLAACVFTLTEHDDHHASIWCTVEIALQSIVVVAATFFIRARVDYLQRSSLILPMMIMVVCLSLVCEPIQRALLGEGHSFEMLIMHSQCNLMLALAACGFHITYQRLAVLIAAFMTIFCCTISHAPGMIAIVAAFAVAALAWLVAAWWENVNRRVLRETRRKLPILQLVAATCFPVLMLWGASGAGANRLTHSLEGWLPSSGGTGEYDPYARGGVNDGDALIAGSNNIKSFAALEDAPFLDSDKPSLYDVFNDTFDEPVKPTKKHQRAMGLSGEVMQHVHRQISEAKQAGREFSLVRGQSRSTRSQARDLNAHALFHVAGRTPAHFRLEVFDIFDGVRWLAGEKKPLVDVPKMRTIDDRPWLSIPLSGVAYDFFRGPETHSIKTSGLDGNVIPTLAHLEGVNIPHVDRLDMYFVDSYGLVSLDRESIPGMTSINMVSQCVDRRAIGANVIAPPVQANNPLNTLPVGDDMDQLGRLAKQITSERPRGWPQIQAIEEYLRDNYVLDREAKVDPDTASPVEDFLFRTRRGPEYQFASAATLMLRSLGYPARVVSGFYASPDNYDDHRHHTPVYAADAHLWCEVRIGASTWLAIEPSPGYELLKPLPTFWDDVISNLRAAWAVILHNSTAMLVLAGVLIVAILKRRRLEDAVRTLKWHLALKRDDRTRARRLAHLIDQRLRLAGLPRRSGTTLRRWAKQPHLTPVRARLNRIADLADQATFDVEDHQISIEPGELNRLASQLSLRELKRLNQTPADMAG